MGPSLDGLFTQSSLGMVLRGTVWLMRRPEAFKVLFIVTKDGEMGRLVDTLRELKLSGVLPSAIHMNPSRWPSPLAPEGSWMAMAGVYGPKPFVDASVEVATKALAPLGTLLVTDPREGPLAPHAGDILRAFGIPDVRDEETEKLATKIVARLQMFADLHRGKPFSEDVVIITPHPSIDDAELPHFGHYTYGPTCPATGRDAAEFVAFIGSIVKSYGFRYTGPSFAFINPRTLVSVGHVVFDRRDPESQRKAKECIEVLVRESFKKGFPPYRVGIQSMDDIDPEGSGYWDTVRKLKAALDPNDVFAPGRYLPPTRR
jgi:4-cresol dehydrogenase (hydroxylating)